MSESNITHSWPHSIKSLCVVGTGLIGASLASALKQSGFEGSIRGCARSRETADRALELGLVDAAFTDVGEAVKDVDLVMLAIPMQAMRGCLEQIAPLLAPGTIVTDGGSVKGSFLDDAKELLGSSRYVVPGHPIAGKEHSGVDAADASLYQGQLVVLTPDDQADPDAVQCVADMWQQCGARIEHLRADHHDRVLAATSHLPHVVAFSLVNMLAGHQSREEVFRYSAGGFRDFTRIASGDPVMWRDICLSNDKAISDILSELIENLQTINQQIVQGQSDELQSIFRNAKTTRDALIEKYDREKKQQMRPLDSDLRTRRDNEL